MRVNTMSAYTVQVVSANVTATAPVSRQVSVHFDLPPLKVERGKQLATPETNHARDLLI